jgi:hypothetical protein
MSLIRGDNVILYVYDGGLWKPVVCGRSCTLNTTAGTIGTSITGSGSWETFEYTSLSWTASLEGLIYLQKTNCLSTPDLRAMQFGRQKILIRYQRTDTSNNVYLEEGTGIITSISDTADTGSAATFSIEIKGTGALTIVFTPTPINPTAKVKRLEYTASGGETSFANAALQGKDIVVVSLDGIMRSKIITAGTPTDQEAKYTSASGTITFPMALDNDMEVVVLYQDI